MHRKLIISLSSLLLSSIGLAYAAANDFSINKIICSSLDIGLTYNNGIHSGIITQEATSIDPYNWDLTSLPDGTGYTITNPLSSDPTVCSPFSIDHTAPAVSGFSNPYIINEGQGLIVDLRKTTDIISGLSGGVAGFEAIISGIVLPTNNNGYRSLSRSSLSALGIRNGSGQSYPISIKVTDSVGNSETLISALIVNNIAPTVSLITDPIVANTSGIVHIAWKVSDPIDIPYVRLEYSRNTVGPWIVISSGSSLVFTGISRDTNGIADSSYYVRISAIDDKNTTSVIGGPIIIDNIPNTINTGTNTPTTTIPTAPNNTSASNGGNTNNYSYSPINSNPTLSADNIQKTNEMMIKGSTDVNKILTPNTITFTDKQVYNSTITDGYSYTRKKDINIVDSPTLKTTQEFKKALTFLYSYDITMFNKIDEFKPNEFLTREQAAKMFTNFAVNVLCRKKDTKLAISYSDIGDANPTLRSYIASAYQLGLMKGGGDKNFRPKDTITKAEFNAVIIRMILKSYLSEDTSKVWYDEYNRVSTELNIINQGAGQFPILRNDATLMLFRAYKNQSFSLQDIDYSSFVLENREDFIK